VDKKKPDPKIYNVAAQRLGLAPSECLVVEDSTIGLQAALGAGMRCIITYTPSTKQQVRVGAVRV
jgi:HAD superfamily hydrolase (TIGR01509 family)